MVALFSFPDIDKMTLDSKDTITYVKDSKILFLN